MSLHLRCPKSICVWKWRNWLLELRGHSISGSLKLLMAWPHYREVFHIENFDLSKRVRKNIFVLLVSTNINIIHQLFSNLLITAYRGNAKLWWKFAYESILETEVKRKKNNWSWDHMLEHRDKCRKYADGYRNKITTKKISADVQKSLDVCEETIDLFNLVLIRQFIDIEVRTSRYGLRSRWKHLPILFEFFRLKKQANATKKTRQRVVVGLAVGGAVAKKNQRQIVKISVRTGREFYIKKHSSTNIDTISIFI